MIYLKQSYSQQYSGHPWCSEREEISWYNPYDTGLYKTWVSESLVQMTFKSITRGCDFCCLDFENKWATRESASVYQVRRHLRRLTLLVQDKYLLCLHAIVWRIPKTRVDFSDPILSRVCLEPIHSQQMINQNLYGPRCCICQKGKN